MFEDEYATEDLIPAAVKHLFKESGDKFVLIGSSEMKTQDDITRLNGALDKERNDHKETKGKLNKFGSLDPDEVHSKLDRIDELEAAAGDKIDEEKINQMVEARIKTKTAPLERQITDLVTERDTAMSELGEVKADVNARDIGDHVRTLGAEAKLGATGMNSLMMMATHLFTKNPDGEVVVKENASAPGVKLNAGVPASVALAEFQSSADYAGWWPESKGAGSRGGDGKGGGLNPFTAQNWNMTQQGQMVKSDPDKAAQMARSAGTTVGGARPTEAA